MTWPSFRIDVQRMPLEIVWRYSQSTDGRIQSRAVVWRGGFVDIRRQADGAWLWFFTSGTGESLLYREPSRVHAQAAAIRHAKAWWSRKHGTVMRTQ